MNLETFGRACVLRSLSVLMLAVPAAALAWTYPLPENGESVVGSIDIVNVRDGEALVDIARTHNLGFEAIRLANPEVDSWLPAPGTEVMIPRQFVLPDAPREGLVINVAEMRLYYYPPPRPGARPVVITHPVSIGRGDWETPIARTKVTRKAVDPTWTPPESVRVAHVERGNPVLPEVVPPGPDNPLGRHALYLGLPSYLLHGTNRPFGIGMRVTHGCIRLYPEDIERLYDAVPVGTKVQIVNQPAKAGRLGSYIYLEVHPPYSDMGPLPVHDLTRAFEAVTGLVDEQVLSEHEVDWKSVHEVAATANGLPTVINRSRRASEGVD
jgi:L,D-transpeptidase ErfK/SrfK